MPKIKKENTLKEYKEIIQNLNPILSDKFIYELQDYIEHTFVEYTSEEIASETFLEFVADDWANEVTVSQAEEEGVYTFSLYHRENEIICVEVLLGVNESETEVMVTDVEVRFV